MVSRTSAAESEITAAQIGVSVSMLDGESNLRNWCCEGGDLFDAPDCGPGDAERCECQRGPIAGFPCHNRAFPLSGTGGSFRVRGSGRAIRSLAA